MKQGLGLDGNNNIVLVPILSAALFSIESLNGSNTLATNGLYL